MPTILIIDDELAITEVMAEVLIDAGYETLTATRGREALALIATHLPDLLLIDIYMPEMSGFDLLGHLRKDAALALIPVVMMTAGAVSTLKLSEIGVTQFLRKPFNLDDLIALVRKLVSVAPRFPNVL